MALRVEAPERQPRSGGIKSVTGEFTLNSRLAAEPGDIGWEDPGCSKPNATRAGCWDDVVAAEDKEPDGYIDLQIVTRPFARYVGKECFLGGDDDQSYLDQAKALLTAWEDREVEAVLWEWAVDAATPGTAADIKAAIAVAEEYADANYVGQPVLLMSRRMASLAGDVVEKDADTGLLGTKLGTPVIATGSAPDDDQDIIVILGRPRVYASAIVAQSVVKHTVNVEMAIAERVYAIGIDCAFRYAVDITPAP